MYFGRDIGRESVFRCNNIARPVYHDEGASQNSWIDDCRWICVSRRHRCVGWNGLAWQCSCRRCVAFGRNGFPVTRSNQYNKTQNNNRDSHGIRNWLPNPPNIVPKFRRNGRPTLIGGWFAVAHRSIDEPRKCLFPVLCCQWSLQKGSAFSQHI